MFFLTFLMSEFTLGQVALNFSSGVNISNSEFAKLEWMAPRSRVGYYFEIGPSYKIDKRVQGLLNFRYSQKGYKTGFDDGLTASEFKYLYLGIIPEVEYRFHDYLSLGLGVNYGLKLDEQIKTKNGGWSGTNGVTTVTSTDFGLTGKLKVNFKNVFGFVRYNIGLKDISKGVFTDGEGQEIPSAKQLNRNLQIGIGYTLELKKE